MSISEAASTVTGHGIDSSGVRRNALLGLLSAKDRASLDSDMEHAPFAQHESLFRSDARTSYVYFPDTAVVSLVGALLGGLPVQLGTTGREGLVGLHVFLETRVPSVEAVVQIPGTVWRLSSTDFRKMVRSSPTFRRLLHRYTEAFILDLAHTATCNTMHRVTERCARWLLAARDRVGSDVFGLSRQSLAAMLSVHGDGITVTLREFENTGLIESNHGSIEILDGQGLAGVSCSCYDVAKQRFAQIRGR